MVRASGSGDRSPTVTERLVSGGVRLIDAEGDGNLSVRRLAEASGRSTMCVYTAFGGREALLAAIHDRAASELRAALHGAENARTALGAWLREHPRLALWLFTASTPAQLAPRRTALMAEVRDAMGDSSADAHRTLATMIGYLALGETAPSGVVG